jgi:hypothetical protein
MPGGRKPGVLAGCSVLQEFEHQLFCRAGVQRSVRSLRGQLCRRLEVPEQFSSLRLGGSSSSSSERLRMSSLQKEGSSGSLPGGWMTTAHKRRETVP